MVRDDFGPRLRAEREARGISLESLAAATKVNVDLWEAMERNDFSRWPGGVFARAFVRDYARVVGLDDDAVVNDFCRLFPIGDRRATRIVRAHAELIGHDHAADTAELLPAGRERRRRSDRAAAPPPAALVYRPRILAAGLDALCNAVLVIAVAALLDAGVLAVAGVVAPLYFTAGTIGLGATPGVRLLAALRHRAPGLLTGRRPVNA